MKLSEEMDITSDLTPENESHYAENFILDKWIRLFGDQFIKAADKITAEAVKPENCSSGFEACNTDLECAASKF